ncbi:MAG: 2OG-Fe(II) oxygenase [Sinobacteraceae bacterium]|nr:2OG-Fe(II) oxygenase [Nevskiaceae bacterium]
MSSTALAGNELAGNELAVELQQRGYAVAQRLLSPQDCAQLIELYAQQERFRSRIVMSRHGYGQGEYQYFGYPLPPLVAQLRQELYPQLVPVANSWSEQLGSALRYPPTHHAFLQKCRRAGQLRPTPLLLKYTAGDYNCLHQDLYGQTVFPLQLTVLLSRPGIDFTGGEFVLTEQRPRMQSRAQVVSLQQGDAVLFAVHHRPVQGKRGVYRVNMRHGVSTLGSGQRYTLGIIFHDAK